MRWRRDGELGDGHAVGDLHFGQDGYVIKGPKGTKTLTRLERGLLLALTERPGVFVRSDALLAQIWGPEYCQDAHLLHDYVSRLRNAFAAIGISRTAIETLHGVGYRLQQRPRAESRAEKKR